MNSKPTWMFFGDFVRLHLLYQASRKPARAEEIVAALNGLGYRLSPRQVQSSLRGLVREGYLTARSRVDSARREELYEATTKGRQVASIAKKRICNLASQLLQPLPDARGQ